jgi:hypothetical protein
MAMQTHQPRWRQMLCLCSLTLVWAAGDAISAETEVVNKIVMELQIQGLSKEGCIVEIAPGHPGCKFKKVRYKVDSPRVQLQPIEVTTLSADRDCSFAITIKEPGMPEQTIRRGLRLTRPENAQAVPETKLTCYLATPSQTQQARSEKLGGSVGGKIR